MRYLLLIASAAAVLAAAASAAIAADDYIQTPAAIDISTVAGDGKYTIDEIARIARSQGISVVLTADGFLNRWQYGLWPLRNIIRKRVETRSVMKYGFRWYLREFNEAQAANPGMVLIPGLEVGPFYYWAGNPFGRQFSIRGWHRHLLVFGIDTVARLRKMPVIGNNSSATSRIGPASIILFGLPLLVIALGLYCMSLGRSAWQGLYELRCGIMTRHWLFIGSLIIALGVIILVNNYPYRAARYDQYHGDRGVGPYQDLIDYVNRAGGSTFWEHPQARNVEKEGGVGIETDEHVDYLIASLDYTGFAVFYEGYERVGVPGGVWDRVLTEYCRGLRRAPAWAIGALDFEMAGDLARSMKQLRTVFLVPRLNRDEVLRSLRSGRMYVVKDDSASGFILDRFAVTDGSSARAAMGGEIALKGVGTLHISGRFTDGAKKAVTITLIRDGEIVKVFTETTPFDIVYDGVSAGIGEVSYYRVELKGDGLIVIANPVFVRGK